MLYIYLYTTSDLAEISDLKQKIRAFQNNFPHKLIEVNLDNEPYFKNKLKDKLPCLDIGTYRLFLPINDSELQFAFYETFQKLTKAKEKNDRNLLSRLDGEPKVSPSEKRSIWFSKHYMFLFNLIVLIYLGIPILAPIFMKAGLPNLATPLYKMYMPLCHQLPYRSWFLFGKQAAYPIELAAIEDLKTFEEITGWGVTDLIAARNFVGNEQMGYKIGLCQRDVAIYTGILIFGIIFSYNREKFAYLPWYLWVLLGLVPIGLDGFSQIFSQSTLPLFNSLPARESTPFIRSLTGSMFGIFTAWFGYPYMRDSVKETREGLDEKLLKIRAMRNQVKD